MEAAFGSGSGVIARATERLGRIFAQASQTPPVAARFHEWQRCWASSHDQGSPTEALFVHHTYVALLARLVARRFVAPRRPIGNDEELTEIINVDYFTRRGIGNFGEGDIFSWVPLDPRWELGLGGLVLETVRELAEAFAPHDFTDARPGILDALYAEPPETPRWLAEHVVEEELGLTEDPSPSILDPVCGTGTFLSTAIGLMRRRILEKNGDEFDVFFDAPEKIRGMDGDPLAVALARLNYLLALGDLVQEEHPPFLLPVYLADGNGESGRIQNEDSVLTLSTAAGEFPLPAPFISNPLMLDWVLGRITNYMGGAQLRLHVQSEEVAVQEVLNAYYNYLTSGKPRTPVPDALTPAQADTALETARRLVHLHIRGQGTFWLHLVQNMAAPSIFAHRGFDRLVTHCPASLFDTYSEAYLRPGGRAAIITTSADAEAHSRGRRLVTMENRLPGMAALVTGYEERASL